MNVPREITHGEKEFGCINVKFARDKLTDVFRGLNKFLALEIDFLSWSWEAEILRPCNRVRQAKVFFFVRND